MTKVFHTFSRLKVVVQQASCIRIIYIKRSFIRGVVLQRQPLRCCKCNVLHNLKVIDMRKLGVIQRSLWMCSSNLAPSYIFYHILLLSSRLVACEVFRTAFKAV